MVGSFMLSQFFPILFWILWQLDDYCYVPPLHHVHIFAHTIFSPIMMEMDDTRLTCPHCERKLLHGDSYDFKVFSVNFFILEDLGGHYHFIPIQCMVYGDHERVCYAGNDPRSRLQESQSKILYSLLSDISSGWKMYCLLLSCREIRLFGFFFY